MAVASDPIARTLEGQYGPIQAVTPPVLKEELDKLYGTLAGDQQMDFERCATIADQFIDELGQCVNLSLIAYPDDRDLYHAVFDGLQTVIDLLHGVKADLIGADGKPRLMDSQERRLAAADTLADLIDHVCQQVNLKNQVPMSPVITDESGDPPIDPGEPERQARRRPR